ncbi:GNAT family N-acetyltransferase [Cellulosimicrobium terreum]|nr:GNAT family N-acetyltransferase [Cellulosimicrobium terreum]
MTDVPAADDLAEVLGELRTWQDDDAPLQLHPGDVGWHWRLGGQETVAALRTWRRDGRLVAVGLLDGPDLLRLGIAPEVHRDEELAQRLADDAARPERGVLGSGEATVESPVGALVGDLLGDAGWYADDPWALLRRDLAAPVEDPGIRVEAVGPDRAGDWAEVLHSSFGTAVPAPERWHTMASGPLHVDARCLVAYDDAGRAVGVVGVWTAGPGRPGLIEPMGVHRDHRGHGYGRAVTRAGAHALRELGASSALVATASSNVAGVATYESAGFRHLPERRDRRRDDPQST